MAERIAYLQAVVGADISSFRYAMQRVRNDIGILGTSINKVSEIARLATFAISAPLTLMGAGFVKTASQFDAAMRNINSMALMSEGQLSSTGDAILEYAQEVRAGGVALAESLAVVYSAGVQDHTEAMGLMKNSTKAAEAVLSDYTTTTEAIVGTVQAYRNENISAFRAANAFVRLFQDGVGTGDEFATAIAKINPIMNALGVELENGYASLAFLTQQGKKANTASTELYQAMSQLLKPSTKMKEAFTKLGVATGEELIEKFGSFEKAVKAVVDTTDGSATAINSMWTNIRGARGVMSLINNFENLELVVDRFSEGIDTAMQESWDQQMASFAAKVDLLRSAFEKLSIVMGQALMPIFEPIIVGLTEIIKGMSELDEETLRLVAVFGLVTAAVPPLVWLFTSMLSPVGLVSGAVIALAGAFLTDFAGVRGTVMNVIDTLTGGLDGLFGSISRIINFAYGEPADFRYGADLNPEVNPEVSAITLQPPTITIPTGSSLGAIWDAMDTPEGEMLRAAFNGSWPELMRYLGENGIVTGATGGETIVLPGPSIAIDPVSVRTNINEATNRLGEEIETGLAKPMGVNRRTFEMGENVETGPAELGFFGKLMQAIEAEIPYLQSEVERIIDTAWTTIKTAATNKLNEVAGTLFGQSMEFEDGETPLYNALRNLLTLDITGLIGELTGNFTEAEPELHGAINNFLFSLGDWIVNTALPTFGRTAGYIVARLAYFLLDAFEALPLLLKGGVETGGSAVGNIVTAIGEGMGDAAADAGVENLGTAFHDSIKGFLENLFETDVSDADVTKMVLSGGLLTAIGMGLRGAFLSATATAAVAPAGAAVASAVSGSIATSLGAAKPTMLGMIVNAITGVLKSVAALTLPGMGMTLGALTLTVGAMTIAAGVLTIGAAAAFAELNNALQPYVYPEPEVTGQLPPEEAAAIREQARYGNDLNTNPSGWGAPGGLTMDMLRSNVEPYRPLLRWEMPEVTADDIDLGAFHTSLVTSINQAQLENGQVSMPIPLDTTPAFTWNVDAEATTAEVAAILQAYEYGFQSDATADLTLRPGVINFDYFRNTVAQMAEIAMNAGLTDTFGANPNAEDGSWTSSVKIDFDKRREAAGTAPPAAHPPKPQATGGFARAGMPYVVGEAGRELFIPDDNGRIIPAFRTNDMLRNRGENEGSVTNNIVINGVRDVDSFINEMKRRGYDVGRR